MSPTGMRLITPLEEKRQHDRQMTLGGVCLLVPQARNLLGQVVDIERRPVLRPQGRRLLLRLGVKSVP
jgi:hypothetical protein